VGYKVQDRGGLWRLVIPRTGKIARTGNNKAVDGGGFRTELEGHRFLKRLLAAERKRKYHEKKGTP